ncbi:MAG: chloramphenicol acetyltransferase [Tenericutes bacterium HGW-Tenericutes-2]|jgi:chloramphenicol O-acetyltransferase|nr:MAG: chloramphenicol acetyltransferase [Tenericutes bacterium HGW-Tenericutes-2]
MHKIDIEKWDRKNTYNFFKDIDVPRYLMTFDLDVTNFYRYVKKNQFSFYLAFIYIVVNQMNEIENFRYRFIDGEPCLFDLTHPSFTDRIENSENFKIVTVLMENEIEKFMNKAKLTSIKQGNVFINPEMEMRNDLVYITTFPWAKYTQVSHAHQLDKFDAIPKLVWGKFEEVNQRFIMPFSIEVHHAFVDGLHVGKFINLLQEKLISCE